MLRLDSSESRSRRIRVYAAKKRGALSRLSLLSSITSQSRGSTGIASTVTPESHSRSERRRTERSDQYTRDRRAKRMSSIMTDEISGRESQTPASDMDVFSYLVKTIADPSAKSTSWEAERNRISKRASIQDDTDEIETKSTRSRFSDSGISTNDSGYDSTSPGSHSKPRLGSLPENVLVEHFEHMQRQRETPSQSLLQMPSISAHSYSQPQYYYSDSRWPSYPAQQPQMSNGQQYRHDTPYSRPALSGYDLLASNLAPNNDASLSLPQLYRRFANLNHRILLQLQDEISEMEADLHQLDDADAQYRQQAPASRRSEWGSARLDLLGKIHMKIEQYHAAVLTIQKVKAATAKAKISDIEVYREWLSANKPLQDPEIRYLDDEADMMSLDPLIQHTPIVEAQPKEHNFYLLSGLAGVWLITCVPSVLSRWFFLLLLTLFTIGAEPSTLTSLNVTEMVTRLRTIAIPLVFWLLVTAIC